MTLKVEFVFLAKLEVIFETALNFMNQGNRWVWFMKKTRGRNSHENVPLTEQSEISTYIVNVWCRRRSVDRGKILHPPAAAIILRLPFLTPDFDNFPYGSANSSTCCIYIDIYIHTYIYVQYEHILSLQWIKCHISMSSTIHTSPLHKKNIVSTNVVFIHFLILTNKIKLKLNRGKQWRKNNNKYFNGLPNWNYMHGVWGNVSAKMSGGDIFEIRLFCGRWAEKNWGLLNLFFSIAD